ncbi:M23 family metallopeptidase [Eisenbergiella massiliensis]|uniref:M23 family metallopeptidase n=1 Tax=Eisenbergiella massiliensis TaxID=1720294 RepID=UPI0023F568F2|nr:M23 family metallopeptidase [Eisenbergiella massiliensis]
MRRRRRSSFRKEKAIMLVSSCLVLTALTATGLYVRNRGQEKEEDNYIVDFTTLDEVNRDKAGEAQELGEQQADAGELDYDPSFQEANSGKVDNPDMKMLGSTANAGEQAAAEQAAAEAAQAEAQQEALAQESQEALEANASDAIAKTDDGNETAKRDEDAMNTVPALDFSESDTLVWPIVGNVLVNYSMDKTVFFATLQQYKYNPAIIIAATQGEGITAAADGQVTTIYEDPEIGTAVIMNLGDGYELTYGQLTDLTVAEGDVVTTGEIIGKVAEPTKYYSVEGCNVYFKLTKDGQPVNPLNRLS